MIHKHKVIRSSPSKTPLKRAVAYFCPSRTCLTLSGIFGVGVSLKTYFGLYALLLDLKLTCHSHLFVHRISAYYIRCYVTKIEHGTGVTM